MATRRVLVAAGLLGEVAAFPGKLASCSAWKPGDAGHMGVSTLGDGSGGSCVINIDALGSGANTGAAYQVTVSSSSGGAMYKLHSSDGQCLGEEIGASMSASMDFTWTAPSSNGPVTFYALCSTGYSNLEAAASVQTSVAVAPTGAPTPAPTGPTPAPTPAPTSAPTPPTPAPPTPAPLPQESPEGAVVASKQNIPLGDSGMTLGFRPVGDTKIELEVTLNSLAWIGIGLSDGDVVSMTGSGGGSDIVTCSSGGARRYWVTGYALAGGTEVPGATCTQESGKTTLKFTRTLAASGGRRLAQDEMAVVPGIAQQVIFARGDDGQFELKKHPAGRMRGGQSMDFASGDAVELAKRSGEIVLWLHLSFMTIGWGGLLPLGAIIAKRYKHRSSWFKWHQGLQILGWALQICGFVMAILYVEDFSTHFNGPHSFIGLFVVVVGTLQPLNGILRPHKPEEGQAKSQARTAWEMLHKGLGWFAIGLGIVNVILGCVLLVSKEYDGETVGVAFGLAACAMAAPAGIAVASCVPGSREKSQDAVNAVCIGKGQD